MAELKANAGWRVVEFISDLHLQASEAKTGEAWRGYMERTTADAVFILGDLFEVWVGDDAARPRADGTRGFEAECAEVMKAAARRLDLFFMRGNRDFLVGDEFLSLAGARGLADPTVLAAQGSRWLLTHGDALCLDDRDYMAFRGTVRTQAWQDAFLARPLPERQALGRAMREQSEARKQHGAAYGDLDAAAAREWLREAGAATMIHGHTHKPADHDLGAGLRRIVLSDWDASAAPPRLQVLRLADGLLARVALA